MKVFYIDNQKVSVQYVKILGIDGFYMGIISRHIPSQYLWGIKPIIYKTPFRVTHLREVKELLDDTL